MCANRAKCKLFEIPFREVKSLTTIGRVNVVGTFESDGGDWTNPFQRRPLPVPEKCLTVCGFTAGLRGPCQLPSGHDGFHDEESEDYEKSN